MILSALGIMAICAGIKGDRVLLWGGVIVLLMGAGLAVYYLSFGVFYDQDTFLLSKFAKKSVTYRYDQIRGQKLYLIQGGNVVIELYLSDGNTLSLQSTMDGVYPFLDAAFAGWCRQTGPGAGRLRLPRSQPEPVVPHRGGCLMAHIPSAPTSALSLLTFRRLWPPPIPHPRNMTLKNGSMPPISTRNTGICWAHGGRIP